MCFDIVLLAVSFWLISLTSVAIAAARNWPEMMKKLVHLSHNLFLPFLLRWLLPLSLPQAAVRYGADPRVFSIMSKVCVRVLYKYRSRYFFYLCSTKLWSYFHKLVHFFLCPGIHRRRKRSCQRHKNGGNQLGSGKSFVSLTQFRWYRLLVVGRARRNEMYLSHASVPPKVL